MVAMSGGVDSSVAAALIARDRGPEACVGVAMRLYSTAEDAVRAGRTCCAPDDLYDARRAASALGIRFFVYDAQERFRDQVIGPFIAAYAQGETRIRASAATITSSSTGCWTARASWAPPSW